VKLTTTQRRIALALGLVLTIVAALFAGDGDEQSPPVKRARSEQGPPQDRAAAKAQRAQPAGPARELALARLDEQAARRSEAAEGVDAFAPRDWHEPIAREAARRAAAAPPAPPPAPQAPPLPFRFIGMMHDAGQTSVFVAQGDRNHIVRPGESIDGTWRLDRVTEKSVLFTFLPLGTVQALPTGGMN
jgi:hypothetical protein